MIRTPASYLATTILGARVGVGMAVGLVLGAALARPLQLVAFRVDPNDPFVYAAIIVTLTLTGLVACLVPAVRAARGNVVQAVKAEWRAGALGSSRWLAWKPHSSPPRRKAAGEAVKDFQPPFNPFADDDLPF